MAIESIVNLTVGKIAELLIKEGKFLYGVEEEVESLQDELIMMNSFLIDIEDLDDEVGDERLRNTGKQIRKIAYDAEDVIETYILEANPAQNKDDFLKRYLCFCKCLVTTHTVGTEIEDITKKITRTMDRLKRYRGEHGLTKSVGEARNKPKVWRPAAYSDFKEDYVVGLDEDTNKLVGSLTTTDNQIQVFSIAGMGGSGKTTLARKVYHNESVKQCFDCMAWVSISQQWVATHVLLDILKKASGEAIKLDEVWSPTLIKDKLRQYLAGRKYLIVLDDVWTKGALDEILPAITPPSDGGSKILVTTRFREVVDDPFLKSSIHEPQPLTLEQSWELFRKIALSDHRKDTISSMEFEDMETLGREMLVKCKGLPLAVVALAGLLAKKETPEDWEKVKKAMSSRIMDVGRGAQAYGAVREMLTLSYNDLPRELKPCFLYLGLFPEDSEIPAGMLIRMWIAEGFISSSSLHEGQTVEDLARDYLNELISRCVVRVASRNYEGKPKTIEIHDLMRDLCNKKAKELEFLEILSARSSNPDTTESQPRRTIIHSYDKMYFPFSKGNWHLRSLFLFARANVGVFKSHTGEDRPKLSFGPIIESFKLLRVLNLVGIDSSDGTLPSEIGNLVHLRYFGLRVTNITQLPSSIGNLRNLLTLDYRGLEDYSKTPKIPDVLWKLESLRHVYLPFDRCTMEKLRFDTLRHLQTLWGGGGNWMLEQLPNLTENVQKLHIEGIETAEQLKVAFECPSITFDRLRTLYFDWLNDGVALANLEHIVNSRRLKKLGLRGRIDDTLACFQFPRGIKSLSLVFTYLQSEATIEAMGRLPNLTVLNLSRDSYVGTEWICTEDMFKQLKELFILDLPNLVEWSIPKGAMPRLEKLRLWQCEKLRRLPQGLKFIDTLQELEFNAMTPEFYSRIRGENAEDAHITQHISIVRYLR